MDAEVAMALTLLNLPEDSDSVMETLTLSMIICNNVSSHAFSQLSASSPCLMERITVAIKKSKIA